MPVSNALKRLLRIRDLEQEQYRLALESAMGELRALEAALERAAERERLGRGEVAARVRSRESVERHPAQAEVEIGARHAKALAPRIRRAGVEAERRRQEFLAKRVELRQAETLIREGEAQEAIEVARQSQQRLDEWYLTRFMRESPDRSPDRGREDNVLDGSALDGSTSLESSREEIPGAQPE
jgi:hypothetical protein